MHNKKTCLDGVLILEPKIFQDDRGFFMESYSSKTFLKNNLHFNFVQDNHSFSKNKYTFRGLHYQQNPKAQTTLIRVVSGGILDIVVDIRKNSPTYGKNIMIQLSSSNFQQLLIPKGFAHGFLTLTDNVNILYKMDEYYEPKYDKILNVKDSELNIDLGVDLDKVTMAIKDKEAPLFIDIENNFVYGENC
ncbi:dTDP-4-dehydrorhamnose 3,5-epimerase [Arcobacter sp. HD9-500m-PIT-SAG03]|nr:dTDP-4-dehydrorhamnose 3,5-epimerase [Arcobacter sp. HD9-500m-PIT-SAG03]